MKAALLTTTLLLAAGCVAMGGQLTRAADDLEVQTDRLYDEVRRDRDSTARVREAQSLAEAADDFHRAVQRGSSREDLDLAFDRVAEPYHDLREYYDNRSTDQYERDRFEKLTTAYLEVEGALKYR